VIPRLMVMRSERLCHRLSRFGIDVVAVSSAGAGQYVEAAASLDPFIVLVGEDGPTSRIRAVRGKTPTTSVHRRISLLSLSLDRPSRGGQSQIGDLESAVESVEVVGQGVRHAVVASSFVGPAAVAGFGFECLDIAALRLERVTEVGFGDEAVAGLADVGVAAGSCRFVSGAVAMGNARFEHLAA